MGCVSLTTTVSIILLFSLDIATDVATGVELVLNDHSYCEFILLNAGLLEVIEEMFYIYIGHFQYIFALLLAW